MKHWNEGAFFWAGLVLISSLLFLYGILVMPDEPLAWHAVPMLLAGTFPWTGLLLKSCKDGISESRTEDLRRNSYLLLWGVTSLAVSTLYHFQLALALVLSFPAFAILIGWNIDRMLREEGGHFTGWAQVSVLTCVLAAAGCILLVQSYPALFFGGFVLGLVLLLMGAGIGIALLYLYVFLLPVAKG